MVTIYRHCSVRLVREGPAKWQPFTSPDAVTNWARSILAIDEEPAEVMYLICLSVKNQIVSTHLIAKGVLDGCIVSPREIYQAALLSNASRIILIHNHPSGNPLPSAEDRAITQKIAEAGQLLDIELLDHIIIGHPDTHSMREHGDYTGK